MNDAYENDPVRAAIAELVNGKGLDYANLSRAIGMGETYLYQFMKKGSPRKLGEGKRKALAKELGIPEKVLITGNLEHLHSSADLDLVQVPEYAVRLSAGDGLP